MMSHRLQYVFVLMFAPITWSFLFGRINHANENRIKVNQERISPQTMVRLQIAYAVRSIYF